MSSDRAPFLRLVWTDPVTGRHGYFERNLDEMEREFAPRSAASR